MEENQRTQRELQGNIPQDIRAVQPEPYDVLLGRGRADDTVVKELVKGTVSIGVPGATSFWQDLARRRARKNSSCFLPHPGS